MFIDEIIEKSEHCEEMSLEKDEMNSCLNENKFDQDHVLQINESSTLIPLLNGINSSQNIPELVNTFESNDSVFWL